MWTDEKRSFLCDRELKLSGTQLALHLPCFFRVFQHLCHKLSGFRFSRFSHTGKRRKSGSSIIHFGCYGCLTRRMMIPTRRVVSLPPRLRILEAMTKVEGTTRPGKKINTVKSVPLIHICLPSRFRADITRWDPFQRSMMCVVNDAAPTTLRSACGGSILSPLPPSWTQLFVDQRRCEFSRRGSMEIETFLGIPIF